MARGILPPECGHPRYNRSWWTIGPQFSAEVYGLITPVMDLEGRARQMESIDLGVFED